MNEVNSLPGAGSKSEKIVRWLVNNSERIACILLFLWCLLPVFMSGYDLLMGALGRFPTADQLPEGQKLGRIVYNAALDMYFKAFFTLGLVTLLYVLLSVALCWKRLWNGSMIRRQPWVYLLGFLLVWAILSTILSNDPLYALSGTRYRRDGLLSYFFFGAIFLCASMISAEKYRRLLLRTFCAVLAWLSVIMFLQESSVGFFLYCFPARFSAVFNNTNHFAYLLCMGITAASGLYLFDRDAGRGSKPLYLAGVCLFTAALLINRTFGAYLGAVFGLAAAYVFYFRSGRKAEWQVFLPAALFLVLTLLNITGILSSGHSVLSDIKGTVSDIGNIAEGAPEADRAGSGRGILWKQTLKRIVSRPIFGFGPEGFYGENALNRNLPPHNEYLQVAGYLGIPALLLYLAALVSMAVHHWKKLRAMPPLVLAASGAAMAYLVSAFVGNPLFNTAPYFWLFFGLTATGVEEPILSPEKAGAAGSLLAKTEKKHLVGRLAPLVAALLFILTAIGVYLSHRVEQSAEIADLQCMRIAESAAEMYYRNHEAEAQEEFWFDAGRFALVSVSEPMPQPCGLGTQRRGNALKKLQAELEREFAYNEAEDYRNRLVKVTAIPGGDGTLHITSEWVEYAPG